MSFLDGKSILVTGARPVPDDFHYSSNTNPHWLTREQLAEILAHVTIEI